MDGQQDDLYLYINGTKTVQPLFCEGTPAIEKSYWGNLFTTLAVYLTGLQATPAWTFSW